MCNVICHAAATGLKKPIMYIYILKGFLTTKEFCTGCSFRSVWHIYVNIFFLQLVQMSLRSPPAGPHPDSHFTLGHQWMTPSSLGPTAKVPKQHFRVDHQWMNSTFPTAQQIMDSFHASVPPAGQGPKHPFTLDHQWMPLTINLSLTYALLEKKRKHRHQRRYGYLWYCT